MRDGRGSKLTAFHSDTLEGSARNAAVRMMSAVQAADELYAIPRTREVLVPITGKPGTLPAEGPGRK
jgi:hypothetical protein